LALKTSYRRKRARLQATTLIAGLSTLRLLKRWRVLATRQAIEGRLRLKIHTPLIAMTKAEIIKTGLELGVDYSPDA